MKIKNKLTSIFFLVIILLVNGQPPQPGSGTGPVGSGTGPVGPGSPAASIDMYDYVLGIIAILLIICSYKYVRKRHRTMLETTI